MKKLLLAGLLALTSLAASAQPVVTGSGLVTGTTPTGIYLTTNTGTSFVPYSSSTFTINGQPIEARYVVDGMNVSVYPISYNNQYGPNYYNGQQNGYYNNGYNNGYNNNVNYRYRRY